MWVLVFAKRVVGITIEPALSRLRGRCDWMARGVRVFGGVPIRRAVTAKRHATSLAGAQMDPGAADLHAFFAFAPPRLLH